MRWEVAEPKSSWHCLESLRSSSDERFFSLAMAPGTPGNDTALPVQVQITTTEERSSMLKSWSVYMVEVNDFGRKFTVEKRFDDFDRLHADLRELEPNMPSLPEKKFLQSTDASVVAERKPAFERILRHLLRSEVAVHEKQQTIFKFLELPTPAIVAFRYLFKMQRLANARQCGKLTHPKYEKDHSYRLTHPAIIRTSLRLLGEGALLEAAEATAPVPDASPDSEDAAMEKPAPAPQRRDPAALAEAEASIVEILRFAVANGNEQTRQFFLQEKGLAVLLGFIFRKGMKEPANGPDPRARGVLNALIKNEGDKFVSVFAGFLETGGLAALRAGTSLLQQQSFAEFVSKLLWLAWDLQVQQVFLAEEQSREALGLLSALFDCPSKGARVCAGLLLACALANRQLAGREEQAAAGVAQLAEEMVASSPCWLAEERPQDAELRSFVQGLGQSPDRFGRIVLCVEAPWRHHDGPPGEESPLWAGCCFALWALLTMRAEPSKLQSLRPALPAVAQGAPAPARWLAGQLLLQLQLQVPADLSAAGAGQQAIVETSIQERGALEAVLLEEIEHSRQGLEAQLINSSEVIQAQQHLVDERQRALPMEAADVEGPDSWQRPLEVALRQLHAARSSLGDALGESAQRRAAAEAAVLEMSQVDLSGDTNEDRNMDQQMQLLHQNEVEYIARCDEQQQHGAVLKSHEEQVEAVKAVMEAADKAVQEMRSRVAALEDDISQRQREVQSKRTLASSDLTATRNRLAKELEEIKQQQTQLREKALQLQKEQDGRPLEGAAAREMDKLKAESSKLRARAGELSQEHQACAVDPQQLEQQALAAEAGLQARCEQRDALRVESQGLEEHFGQTRADWQQAMSGLQQARQEKEAADLEATSLKRQLEGQWAAWQPSWSRRLELWRRRMALLAAARKATESLASTASDGWERLRREAAQRSAVLEAVDGLQQQLAALVQDLSSIDDEALRA
eukprot:s1777_g3.t2